MEELEEALNNSPADKTPGPDGFSMGSMKMLWPLIKDELLDCMIKFQTSGTLPGGMNSSFICLIPKCVSPKHVQEYRPISLINSSMKLLSKMLASRLSKVIGNIVSEEQTGFIKGRLITDGILMIGEIINSIKSKQSEGLIFKIDFEKAFDSVDWSFLFHLLEKLNFSYDWIRWIKVILKSSKTSILVNGSPTREFSQERGLRQGDPLSPLLFDLVAQVLSCMIKKAEQLGIIDGVKISNSSEVITHLQYADDTVIFIRNSMKSVMGIKSILQGFQLLTGLKINFDKSQLYGIGQDKDLVGNWARILGCAVGGDSFIYLGMEVLKSSSSVRYWDPLIGKVKKKLANWKGKSISMAGRAVLLKAAIDSLPTYWMSLHKIPRTVIKDIDRIRRKFLWSYTKSNGEVSNKMHSLAWENVCRPKEEGGLGLKLLEEKNASMLFKWWHRCFTERSKLWNKMLKNKYGTHVWVDPGLVDKNKNMSATFRNICRIGEGSSNNRLNARMLVWRVYNGEKALFWEDSWTGSSPLKVTYSRLYALSSHKWTNIKRMVDLWKGGELNGECAWQRRLRAWEEEVWAEIENILKNVKLSSQEDQLIWSNTGKAYKVGDGYKALITSRGADIIWNNIWKIKAPHKVRLLLWKIEHGILPVKVFLKNRLHASNFNVLCGWCGKYEESLQHLMKECELANWVWVEIAVWWDIPLSRFNSATFSLRNIFSIIDDLILNKAWKSVVAASLWYIWISRNNKVFNLSTIDKNSLINNVKMRVYSWLLSSGLIENDHWREWKHIPRSVIQQSWLRKREKLWEVCKKKYEIICLVDGAFLQGPKAGKGGCIKDRDGNILFIFFGPSNALNSFEAEWDAAIFMIKSVLEHKQKWNKICLCTDSIKVIKKLKRIKRSQLWGELGLPDILGVALDNFEFIHLGRELNLEADGLAKAGMQKAQMVKGWL
nr:PREDICTED: uncharacterized protein LOC108203774 [Daucus carota subsp. sativus]